MTLTSIADALPGPGRTASRERRLRRWLAKPRVDPAQLWALPRRGLLPRVVGAAAVSVRLHWPHVPLGGVKLSGSEPPAPLTRRKELG